MPHARALTRICRAALAEEIKATREQVNRERHEELEAHREQILEVSKETQRCAGAIVTHFPRRCLLSDLSCVISRRKLESIEAFARLKMGKVHETKEEKVPTALFDEWDCSLFVFTWTYLRRQWR